MEKVVFNKKSINQYLTACDKQTLPSADQLMCIDKLGNFSLIELSDVRRINQSEWNHNPEFFGEKVTFINDYISFSYYTLNNLISIDISSDTKPTEAQLEALFNYVTEMHKRDVSMYFKAWWRWTPGGGCSMDKGVYTKFPKTFRKKVMDALDKESFDGYNIYRGFEVI